MGLGLGLVYGTGKGSGVTVRLHCMCEVTPLLKSASFWSFFCHNLVRYAVTSEKLLHLGPNLPFGELILACNLTSSV